MSVYTLITNGVKRDLECTEDHAIKVFKAVCRTEPLARVTLYRDIDLIAARPSAMIFVD